MNFNIMHLHFKFSLTIVYLDNLGFQADAIFPPLFCIGL